MCSEEQVLQAVPCVVLGPTRPRQNTGRFTSKASACSRAHSAQPLAPRADRPTWPRGSVLQRHRLTSPRPSRPVFPAGYSARIPAGGRSHRGPRRLPPPLWYQQCRAGPPSPKYGSLGLLPSGHSSPSAAGQQRATPATGLRHTPTRRTATRHVPRAGSEEEAQGARIRPVGPAGGAADRRAGPQVA